MRNMVLAGVLTMMIVGLTLLAAGAASTLLSEIARAIGRLLG